MGPAKTAAIVVGVFFLAVAILVASLVISSLKKLESTEVAIQYNTYTKRLQDEPFYEGLHAGPPGYQFVKFSSVFKTLSYSGLRCLNEEGVSITMAVSFQYRVRPSTLVNVVKQFKDESTYADILRSIGSSAIHDICSMFNTSQFQSERGRFQEDLTFRLVSKFRKLDCDVQDLQVNNIHRPEAYENGIKAKESAREDIEVARNENPRRVTEAHTTRREAETEADIILDLARTEAKIVTNRAIADAKGILNDYTQEAESYKSLKEANGLDNEGFLAYLGIRVIANAKNPVYIGMKAPAKTAFLQS